VSGEAATVDRRSLTVSVTAMAADGSTRTRM
jgi:hypothetical protein